MIEALIILVLLLATVYYVTTPLFQTAKASSPDKDHQASDRYERIGDELADLEFEVKAGKLPREDFEHQREKLEKERELLDRS